MNIYEIKAAREFSKGLGLQNSPLDDAIDYLLQLIYLGTSQKRPAITVAKVRGPEVIAREINRRLLPDYIKMFDRLQESFRSRDARAVAEVEAMSLIAEVACGRVPDHLNQTEPGFGNLTVRFGEYNGRSRPYGKADRFYQGRLRLELEQLLPAEAEAVLQLLIKLRSET